MSFNEYKSAEYWQQQREEAQASAEHNASLPDGKEVLKNFFGTTGLIMLFVGAYWLMAILEL